jgi:hypothetical protein
MNPSCVVFIDFSQMAAKIMAIMAGLMPYKNTAPSVAVRIFIE